MKTKSVFTVLLLAGVLVGCSETTYVSSSDEEVIKDDSDYYTEVCIKGVVYYRVFPKALAPAFNVDSTVKTCGGGL